MRPVFIKGLLYLFIHFLIMLSHIIFLEILEIIDNQEFFCVFPVFGNF
jgi:hypothetical protein